MTYEEHYIKCQKTFLSNKSEINNPVFSLSVEKNCLVRPLKYDSMISSLRVKAQNSFEQTESKQIKKTNFAINHVKPLCFPEVSQIIEGFYDEISNKIFNCNFTTNRISLYKSIYSDSSVVENTWRWHWDNNPRPHIKLFIYLTDVDEGTAPFSYLKNVSGEAIKMESSKISPKKQQAPKYKDSRIPDDFLEQKRKKEGFFIENVYGKAGTFIVFDPNIIHRATVPFIDQSRIALVYHMHPTTKNENKFYSRRGTNAKAYNLL